MSAIKSVAIDEFLNARADIPIWDVRSPGEYLQGHIPGALNLPLFDDEERARIGIIYRQQGREAAMLEGLSAVGPRMRTMVETVNSHHAGKVIRMHCWRGGMRSSSVAWLMQRFDMEVILLEGGYKQFRRRMLESLALTRPIIVLGGATGSGKTVILQHLKALGEQVIDLEGLAHHKGSSFGSIGEAPPPTQEHFENQLALAWLQADPLRPVWIEDESRRVGPRHIPNGLWHQIRSAPVLAVDVPLEIRVERLLEDYGNASPDLLSAAIDRLQKRLGGLQHKVIHNALKAGDLRRCCHLLLSSYYDKAYHYGLSRREPETIYHCALKMTDMAENTRQLLAFMAEKQPHLQLQHSDG